MTNMLSLSPFCVKFYATIYSRLGAIVVGPSTSHACSARHRKYSQTGVDIGPVYLCSIFEATQVQSA